VLAVARRELLGDKMGIGIESVHFLNHVRTNLGVCFDRTAMIGRQAINAEEPWSSGYAEPLFRSLGAAEVTSFDASNYEGAEHIHDFNLPIDEKFYNRFSAVFDGGTMEHIFNYPQAVANCMKMVEVGGYFLAVNPTNNYAGHGFYQISSEVFFRVFSPENGFAAPAVWVCRAATKNLYEVHDPNVVVGLPSANQVGDYTVVMAAAKKIANVPLFTKEIQSALYATIWKNHDNRS
jgi:hypothetical protein